MRKDLEAKKRQLLSVKEEAMVSGNNSLVRNLKAKINILLDGESRIWNQWSRVLWLSKGHSNIKFFHSKATKRFQRNSIMEIQDTNGRWLYQTVDIGQSFIWYYSELFFLFEPHQVQEALENIPQVVTKPSNFDLIGTFHE